MRRPKNPWYAAFWAPWLIAVVVFVVLGCWEVVVSELGFGALCAVGLRYGT